ncbi:MAG: aminofutalosine deaminase family hydrolase [Sulfuricurvum sp.]
MKIIAPTYILTPDTLLTDQAIAFEKNIVKIAPLDELKALFHDAKFIETKPYSLLMSGLINSHLHLEFSSNKTTLKYGSFLQWLYSVMASRDELISSCDDETMRGVLDGMLKSGITTIGAVSSYGFDLTSCVEAKQNVVYFSELIGSDPQMIDTLYDLFLARYEESKRQSRDGFYPSIAIHSPYSTHPQIVKKALELAYEDRTRVSAHFMESFAEREWLDSSSGEFKEFFSSLLKRDAPTMSSSEFLALFDGIKSSFVHAIFANDAELETIKRGGSSIISCPISNRLLGGGKLDLEQIKKHDLTLAVATDGLSSNYTLDLFEELRVALFMHYEQDLASLAKDLILSVTKNAAKALDLPTGEIKEGLQADMIVLDLGSKAPLDLHLGLILQRYNIYQIFIRGEFIDV